MFSNNYKKHLNRSFVLPSAALGSSPQAVLPFVAVAPRSSHGAPPPGNRENDDSEDVKKRISVV